MIRLWKRLVATAGTLLIVLGMVNGATAQTDESTWERIQRTGEIRFAVFNYPPYFVKDLSSGEWGGSLVDMARDAAAELKVEAVMTEVGGWGELVLALTTNKIDLAAGMQATPVRATAIDFAGADLLDRMGGGPTIRILTGVDDWSDYNSPDVKMAVMTGTSDQLLLSQNAPNATQLQFKELSQIILAVSSGRADAFTTTVLSSMIAKEKNPGLGNVKSPKPRTALPGYFGIRADVDQRFKNYLNWWAEWNNKLGHNERRMKEAMIEYSGITSIPESISFKE